MGIGATSWVASVGAGSPSAIRLFRTTFLRAACLIMGGPSISRSFTHTIVSGTKPRRGKLWRRAYRSPADALGFSSTSGRASGTPMRLEDTLVISSHYQWRTAAKATGYA